jgi:hypothetical protein
MLQVVTHSEVRPTPVREDSVRSVVIVLFSIQYPCFQYLIGSSRNHYGQGMMHIQ